MAVIEKTKSELVVPRGKKLPNLGKDCPQLWLSSMPCEALQKQGEKRERKMLLLITWKEEDNSNDAWKCKSCEEIWHGEDDNGNRWIVCDTCDGKYHLHCSVQEFITRRQGTIS